MAAVSLKPPDDAGWFPTPRQSDFLAADEDEVLFGGAAGGGKTDGLLVDALGINPSSMAIKKRAYQAIIFRRTYPDLKDIIDRSHEIYPIVSKAAKYDKAAHVWNFPGGARIEFGFIQRDVERFRYRGRAFGYIGWEELTLWPTPLPYMYLRSRLRAPTSADIQCFIRATTNPDGPGFRWVRDYFRIQQGGGPTRFEVELNDKETGETFIWSRRFIPSRLSDNPYLGADYRATLLGMDEDEQDALLRGIWKQPQIKGAYYEKEMLLVRQQERIVRNLPYIKSIPVDTYWDIGANDTTAIWCGQPVAQQQRWLRAHEQAGESYAYFAKWLMEQGFLYGTHYLPHDAAHERQGKHNNKSAQQMLQELMPGHRFVIVPRIDDVTVGIQQTRDKFESCVFDEEGTAEGVAALENYTKKWSEDNQVFGKPKHDWASNYADAFRQWGQAVPKSPAPKINVPVRRMSNSRVGY